MGSYLADTRVGKQGGICGRCARPRRLAPGTAHESGFVTLTIMLLAACTFLVLSMVLDAHGRLARYNRHFRDEIQQRAATLRGHRTK
jgi:hypothetical protein